MRFGYTDVTGCVRFVDVQINEHGTRIERDMLTRQGRKEWARRVEASRARALAKTAADDMEVIS